MSKLEKEVQKGIDSMKEGKSISFDDMKAKWKKEEDWAKKHPVLFFFKDLPWKFYRAWHNHISDWPWDIKNFYQRGVRGYDDSCWWRYNNYIAKMSIPMLKSLRDKTHIVRTEMLPPEHPYNARIAENWHDLSKEDEDFCEKEWTNVLNKIIFSFECICKLSSGEWDNFWEVPDKQKEWWDKHVKEFNIRAMTKEEDLAMKEGLVLYGKHFNNFYD